MDLKFDEKGLIPAIVQDHYTKEVLTLAYMNAETLALTIAEGRTVFWSRSRQEIWRKGETSGNVQRVVSITADCDADALVVEVVKSGPACHTGAESCFFNEVYVSPELKQFSWQGLYDLIKGRKTSPKEGSYTTYLFEKGKEKILKKVGEECTEVIIAGEKEDKAETSGNVQRVVSITADCDADALVVEVVKSGPACHTGAESCFFNEVYVSPELKQFSWQGLYDLIKGRKTSPKEGSYTTYLFEKGKEKILKKVGEECTEVIIAGEKEDKAETVYEISDLAYHVLVLMVQAGITVEDITRELEKRHVIDHKVKQERMQ